MQWCIVTNSNVRCTVIRWRADVSKDGMNRFNRETAVQ